MDTSKAINHISLCAGYGGIDLGLRRVFPACRTVAYVEIEAFAVANLVAKMEEGELDPAPIWTNLKTLPLEAFPTGLEIISGGFPCQPFSSAGKREGDEDPRHLFPYIKNAIRTIQPRIVFLENVEGIISAKLKGDGWEDPAGTPVLLHVIRELERVGYRATAGVFSAAEVGATHQRKRVFILAHSKGAGLEGLGNEAGEGQEGWQKEGGPVAPSNCSIKSMADPTSERGERWRTGIEGKYTQSEEGVSGWSSTRELADANECGGQQDSRSGELRPSGVEQSPCHRWPSRPGEAQQEWEEPRVVGDAEGRQIHGGKSGELGKAAQGGESGPTTVADPSAELADHAHGGERPGCLSRQDGEGPEVFGGQGSGGGSEAAELADNYVERLQNPTNEQWSQGSEANAVERTRIAKKSGRQTESQLGGATDGSTSGLDPTANRVDRLRLLGNGVVPDTAEVAFRTLYKELIDGQQSNQS